MENTKSANQNNISKRTIVLSALFIITIIVVMMIATGCKTNEVKVQPSAAEKPDDAIEEVDIVEEPELPKQEPNLPEISGVSITNFPAAVRTSRTFFGGA